MYQAELTLTDPYLQKQEFFGYLFNKKTSFFYVRKGCLHFLELNGIRMLQFIIRHKNASFYYQGHKTKEKI